jgi:DNA repair exonuclease SbcCD ATPase subunit
MRAAHELRVIACAATPRTRSPARWIMKNLSFGPAAVKRPVVQCALALAFVLLLVVLTVPVRPAFAAGPDAITPVEDFSKELDKLKKSFGDLGKKMDESAKAIEGYNDVEKARKEIEELRGAVAALLDAVADNGGLATLGDKALGRAREKLKELEQDTRFKPEERAFLVEQWRKLRDDTERANQELGGARTRFAELLRTLQANEDFIDELVQIRQAQKVIEVIHQLTRDIRGASDQLQRLIGAIKPPGA